MANEITGKTGLATVAQGTNTHTLNITGWSVTPNAMEHRTDNTGGNGYSDRVTSILDCKFTINANIDSQDNLFDTPTIVAGANLIGLKLYLQGTNSGFFSIPLAKVTETPIESKVDDLTKWTITGANKGTFSYPTGTFTASVN
jgi:hypothetical protein